VEAGEWRRLVWDDPDCPYAGSSGFSEREKKVAEFLNLCVADGIFLIEKFREQWLKWIDRFPFLLP
jgi:hypothetical protein